MFSFERFDETIEREGFVEKQLTKEERVAFSNNFKSKVKPVLYKGKYIYVSPELAEKLLNGEISEEAVF